MTDIPAAIAELEKYGIEAFELSNILVIPYVKHRVEDDFRE